MHRNKQKSNIRNPKKTDIESDGGRLNISNKILCIAQAKNNIQDLTKHEIIKNNIMRTTKIIV